MFMEKKNKRRSSVFSKDESIKSAPFDFLGANGFSVGHIFYLALLLVLGGELSRAVIREGKKVICKSI